MSITRSLTCALPTAGDTVITHPADFLAFISTRDVYKRQAMGKFGADVARGTADIVISNSRFGSIVCAIKESRGLFDNIRKSVYYLLSCNFAELLYVFMGMLVFSGTPLSAVQLLWINLLTDCAPAISISMEKAEDEVMKRKPYRCV